MKLVGRRGSPRYTARMNPQERQDLQNATVDLLGKQKPLSAAELQQLRQSTAIVSDLSSHYDPLRWRMDIELIDAVRLLNLSSTRLMIAGIAVALVGVSASLAQIIIALRK